MRVEVAAGMSVDPALMQVITAWTDAGHWAFAVDARWRSVVVSDELASVGWSSFVMGEFIFGSRQIEFELSGSGRVMTAEDQRNTFVRVGRWLLRDIPGGRDALRELVDPSLINLVDDIEPCDDDALSYQLHTAAFGGRSSSAYVAQRVRDASGQVVGTVFVIKPAVGMNVIGMLTGTGDLNHFAVCAKSLLLVGARQRFYLPIWKARRSWRNACPPRPTCSWCAD